MNPGNMTLRVWTPERLILEKKTEKVIAEAANGFFCLLPRHIDYLAGLVPSVLSYTEEDEEQYVAVDKGILVKCGMDVMVSVRNAIRGENLEAEVRDKFHRTDEKEQEISNAMNQLEANFIRRFVEMTEERSRG